MARDVTGLRPSNATGGWWVILLACALALKLLVPAGYMPTPGQMAVQLCTGQGVQTVLLGADGQPVEPADHRQTKATPCAYTGLGTPAISAADPLLLAIAIALVMALGTVPRASLPRLRNVAPRPPSQPPPLIILT